jgi:integral membrane protein
MLQAFRIISLLEGLSYIAILSVTLGFVSRDFVSTLGMLHGVLFMLYLLLSVLVANKKEWSLVTLFSLFAASVVPFAFVAVEFFIKREVTHQKSVEV